MQFYRRHLPHLHALNRPIFITWRLHGTLPPGRSFPSTLQSGKAFVAFDRLLDEARTGPAYLKLREVAGVVDDAIRQRDDCELHAYVVMSNHVHLLITPFAPV